MSSRFLPRLSIFAWASVRRASHLRRTAPATPRRILLAHHLLLGDTLMLTPLVAKLRALFPEAEITMTLPGALMALYSGGPYGLRALPWNPRDNASVKRLLAEPTFDLALVPGDNRHAWLAQAMGARWIVAFAGDRPRYKDWPVDELRSYASTPATWFDMTAGLVDGPAPAPFTPGDWPAPRCSTRDFAPDVPYAVLHVGASSRLKLWPAERWRELAGALRRDGLAVVWSAGPGESHTVDACTPADTDRVLAGQLDLGQMWHLIHGARLLVAPDTGIAHVGRIAGTPTIALFGPGSALLAGEGDFWRNSPYRALTIDPFPCRDQHLMFKREIPWVRICKRPFEQCGSPRCMQGLSVARVLDAWSALRH